MKTTLFFAIVILAAIVGTAYPEFCDRGCYCCEGGQCIFDVLLEELPPNCFLDRIGCEDYCESLD
ncbi:hypothetical protein HOLleu_39374 [Holothuria leucospilota]|uniref:Uncharacterized protein n=1 Tax=Holothuria leucospilota TaxID=206669 RepID=A0A9Q1BE25_HOLLE|nr:hypothetical protein HOLleu_39374 [Holothuria leucospilota]